MKKNMGTIDRIVRVLIAVVVGVLFFTEVITGTLAIVLGVLAIIFVATSLVSFCPLYLPFGLSTCPAKTPENN
ncbi:MAG: DUF2892 domain-containing protein [Bacteroidetes bacterium]|nr:MAG: DUF2892 domain-containing protein [Bacteroidota bacterium]